MSKVAFIGLGVMGFPMAGHLARAGHDVAVYNRSADPAIRWAAAYAGRVCATPQLAARAAEVVISCVGNDDDLRDVTVGAEGAFAAMAAHTVYVDHSTTSARVARELAAVAAARHIAFLDAPVPGGQVGAETGQLTIMVGGDAPAYTRIEPLLH